MIIYIYILIIYKKVCRTLFFSGRGVVLITPSKTRTKNFEKGLTKDKKGAKMVNDGTMITCKVHSRKTTKK